MMQNIALFAGGDIGLRSLNCLLPLHCNRKTDLSWPQKKIWGHVRAFDWESVLDSAYTELGGKSVYLFARSPGGKGLS